ncbi:acyltransferase family protein [Lichenifustis flavocetrariae]|uniref:Acyltransferase n=1 Tax=Lichenifustis flavocetrariae TaxID=2949735 RepID=A0AA42CKR3_9HYPH|nr:acyltransferase [Lichenifustis flavocetrariae]MCW6506560.1 acyltransferase [Lichenifustis flavocetrariae]
MPLYSRSSTAAPAIRHLDMLRAGAAMAVLLSHARDFTLRDAADQPGLNWAGRLVFGVSGLGHQAVLVFFVLSGYLVTSSMLRLEKRGRWSLGQFAAARLTRLWIVLVPCLLGGALLDAAGLAFSRDPGLAAHYGVLAVTEQQPPDFGGATLIGNLLFLQTIAVPVYGSNGALWSLANEAWYYVVAALLFAAWHDRTFPGRALFSLGLALAVAAALPGSILSLAPVWACGAVCAVARPERLYRSRWSALLRRAAIPVWAAALLASRLRLGPSAFATDLAIGAATAWLVSVAVAEGNSFVAQSGSFAPGRTVSGSLARISYSLYLSHCPLLALLSALVLDGRRIDFGWTGVALLAGGMALSLLLAATVWWACERHTEALRAWLTAGRFAARAGRLQSAPEGLSP